MRRSLPAALALLVALILSVPSAVPQALPRNIPLSGSSFDVDMYGNICVLDAEKNTLHLYDRSGTLQRDVGGPGWLDGQFDRPAAVWARNGIDVYVADFGNHRIERFDRSLSFVSSFSTRSSDKPDERFGYPSGVSLSRLGELFICDTENGQIVKVDRFSTVERTFGGITGGKGHLGTPNSVAVGPKDAVYVLDGERVAVFDAFGNYLRDLLPGLLRRPSVLFADNDVVAVLDSTALFLFDAEERPAGAYPAATLVPAGRGIRALQLSRGSLYVLTEEGILIMADPRHAPGLENNPISH